MNLAADDQAEREYVLKMSRIFNTVAKHLFVQKKPSGRTTSDGFECRY